MTELQIVLADDDADDRLFFSEAVEKVSAALKLTTVEDGEQLMEMINKIERSSLPDVIFLDINMPGKTGDVCLKEIRANNKFQNVPIIIFSTSTYRPFIKESYENGASMYVSKSVFFDDEVGNLKKILSTDWKQHMLNHLWDEFIFR
jgi:CheY-like chemotaxis protein